MNPIDPPSPHDGCDWQPLPQISNRIGLPGILAGIRGAGLRWSVALGVLVAGASLASAQSVTLGTASFTGTSDRVAADWYWPLPDAVTYTYDGYGEFAGATRTETYSRGQSIAGVKAVQWHFETRVPGAATPEVEDWWLAFDAADNLCVLQVAQSGSTVFTASARVTPPVWLPGKPVQGQKWDIMGNSYTVEDVSTSSLHAGAALKLGIRAPGQPVEYMTYNAGIGVVHDAMNESPRPSGSGWRLRLR